ncbi:hypothetical protein B0J13DRAFT_588213 [Dactylonectria estremocensis]|uniref:Uncharacterized protein n=1 Tax=Dactylonectria estremocensis TaxID=1079267 RepID=A0A9P9E3D5_9HYPO|nr:hypothetical protein B0J13DRAFT_588213 [Dactylonectria estremocensis]
MGYSRKNIVASTVALDLYEAKTETSPIKNGGKKTKDRFWTSNGHLLPSVWDYKRPKNIKIMGLVFYGRRQSVSILDCYLKRNLAKNGGMLDGVIFVERTKDALDLGLLHRLLESEPAYEKWHIGMAEDDQFASGFGNSYDRIEDDVLYIKMDDDIVFMEDSVIPSIIQKKVEHPEHYIVSANVVNQPLLSWVHWSLNAVKPYLPELNRTSPMINSSMDWRPSQLPYWTEYQNFNLDEWEPSDHGLHRWLPLNRTKHNILDNTPIKQAEYNAFGRGWTQWKMGAQEHYSFLENLEKDELWQYKFDTWDFQFERMGIQFIAMMGHDINIAKPIEADDENHFSCTMTRQLGRGAVADGRGLAVHYSFGSQREGMRKTDVLERYRAFAQENICAGPMLWFPGDDEKHSS